MAVATKRQRARRPASGCPTIANNPGLNDDGIISGTTGTYRVCTLPARFTTSTNLQRFPVCCTRRGRVDVGCDLGAGTPRLPRQRLPGHDRLR